MCLNHPQRQVEEVGSRRKQTLLPKTSAEAAAAEAAAVVFVATTPANLMQNVFVS